MHVSSSFIFVFFTGAFALCATGMFRLLITCLHAWLRGRKVKAKIAGVLKPERPRWQFRGGTPFIIFRHDGGVSRSFRPWADLRGLKGGDEVTIHLHPKNDEVALHDNIFWPAFLSVLAMAFLLLSAVTDISYFSGFGKAAVVAFIVAGLPLYYRLSTVPGLKGRETEIHALEDGCDLHEKFGRSDMWGLEAPLMLLCAAFLFHHAWEEYRLVWPAYEYGAVREGRVTGYDISYAGGDIRNPLYRTELTFMDNGEKITVHEQIRHFWRRFDIGETVPLRLIPAEIKSELRFSKTSRVSTVNGHLGPYGVIIYRPVQDACRLLAWCCLGLVFVFLRQRRMRL